MTIRKTVHTALASYAGMGSAVITSLLMIRLATQSLSQEEFGLWSFTMQSIGYFLLLDFGVSNSLGRLFGEPLASGDQEEINRWFTLSSAVLAFQGLIILALGVLSREWILSFFNIPPALHDEASLLWTVMLILQAVNLPFRVTGAILYAQNRSYWSNLFPVAGSWAGFAVFWVMLEHGAGVMSYAWSSGVSVLIGAICGIIAILRGPHRFGLGFKGISRKHLKDLFSYASATFIIAIAIQVEFASQGLILTKLIGLDAAAIFNVTSRVPYLLMQILWKPFDAFSPRWQQAHVEGRNEQVSREFSIMTRASILITAAAACGIILANPSFVSWWTKPEYFGGNFLNILLAVWLMLQTVTHCFSLPFGLHKQMTLFASIVAVSVLVQVLFSVFLVLKIGMAGIVLASLILAGCGLLWFILIKGGRLMEVSWQKILSYDGFWWIPSLILAGWLSQTLLIPQRLTGFLFSAGLALLIAIPCYWKAFNLLRSARTNRL